MKYALKLHFFYRHQALFTKASCFAIVRGAKSLCFSVSIAVCLLASPSAAALSWFDILRDIVKSDSEYQQPVDLHQLIDEAAIKHQLPPSFIAAIIRIESNFDGCAFSHKHAQGIMQLLEKTALSVGIDDPFDPVQGIRGGSSYLARAYQDTRDLYMSAAYYNAGPKVLKLQIHQWPHETQDYIRKLSRVWKKYQGNQWKRHVPKQVERTNRRICSIRL